MKHQRLTKDIVHYVKTLKDSEGYACIDIKLNPDTELYDPLSTAKNLDLNKDIYEFIDEQANIIPARVPLRIRFIGTNLSPEEQELIRQTMRRHYTMKTYDVVWDMALNLRKMIGFTVFGIGVLAAYFYVSFATDRAFATEILSIIGSFSLWEAADAYLLERPVLRREYKNIMQNVNQFVEFVQESDGI